MSQVHLQAGPTFGEKWPKSLLTMSIFLDMNSSMNLGQVRNLKILLWKILLSILKGDIFNHPELLIPGVADVTNLAPAYEVVCFM